MIQELKNVWLSYGQAQGRLNGLMKALYAIYETNPALFPKSPKEMGASELMRMGQALAKLLNDLEKDNNG